MHAYRASLDPASRVNARRGALCRWWPLLGVAFVILAWVANVGHLTLVPHAVCSDHGQLVHVGDAHGTHAAAPDHASRGQSITADGGDHGHEHCWAAAAEVTLTLSAGCAVACLLSWSVTAWRPTPRAAAYARRYLLAPKTSPPLSS